MPEKTPFQYELSPQEVDPGVRWVTLMVRNMSNKDLKSMSVQLNSRDTYQIDVHGTGSFVPVLRPNEAQTLPFQLTAQGTTQVYATVDGRRGEEEFRWESPGIRIVVGVEVARIVSLFALTEPYPILGTTITAEATIEGLGYNEGLGLEFWAETPDGELLSLAKLPTDPIAEGEVARYTVEFTPDKEGIYTLHAYLFAGVRRIDHATEYLSITR
ncbi:MAG: hypothetical protein ACP5HS_08690 [Anaerolineae bacterium]